MERRQVIQPSNWSRFHWEPRAEPASFELMPENLSIQEEEGGERLVLRGGRHVAIDREVRKELDDLDRPHVIGVSNTVVVDVPPDPTDVGLLGS